MKTFALFILICTVLFTINEANLLYRVVGGVDAKDGEFPHQVSLRRNGSHTCGGSIISRNFILTAAHCVGTEDETGKYFTYSPSAFSIRVGSTERLNGGLVYQITAITPHEMYSNFLNDVAILKVKEPLIYSIKIQPIRLATSEVPSGSNVIISGWGRIKQGGDIPSKLQKNTLIALNRIQCKERIRWDSDCLICLDHLANNGACNGDSGGPAVYNNELVGIAGFVVGGCGTSNPDGYAKVYYHFDWIRKQCYDC